MLYHLCCTAISCIYTILTLYVYTIHTIQYLHHIYRDKYQRSELCKASVEFVAPGDYMVRPPQPPAYVFVIDVSSTSVQSGMIGRRSV